MRAPPLFLIEKWIVHAWINISTELVISSFKHCAIGIDRDENGLKLVSSKLKSLDDEVNRILNDIVKSDFYNDVEDIKSDLVSSSQTTYEVDESFENNMEIDTDSENDSEITENIGFDNGSEDNESEPVEEDRPI